jgi:energy-coupling factor transporter transmembrane protein EcfT
MEARSYNPRCIRTRYRSYGIKWYDWFFLFFITIFFAFFCFYTAKHFFFNALGWPEAILNYGV